jgi:Fic family protein
VQALFAQPYCRIQNLVEGGIAKRQTAAVYLNELTRIGVLEKRSEGRENIFLNPRLISVMLSPENDYSSFQ